MAQGSPSAADALSEDSHVTVVIRLRPPAESQDEEAKDMYRASPSTLTVRDPLSRGKTESVFTFNRILLPEHCQDIVFEYVAKPLVDHVLAGFNTCCFAYGQTGSGKTHSVFGEPSTAQRGMLPRSVEYLFQMIQRQNSFKEVGMVVSFVEIYLNQVRDLGRFYANRHTDRYTSPTKGDRSSIGSKQATERKMSSTWPDPDRKRGSNPRGDALNNSDTMADNYMQQDLAIHESPQGHVFIEDLSLIPVTCVEEVLDVAYTGMSMRATYETKLNATSSRSHAVFTVSIVQKSRRSEKTGVVGSMLNFIDLAGSERLARSQSEGRRFQEAVVINSSLSALGKVVLALANGGARHVPYRDSKLTRILQNSLGGNSYTTLLTTIDPSTSNYDESLNSLMFADRCKNVSNRPVINEIDQEQENDEKLIHRLLTEIAQLKAQVETSGMLVPGAAHGQFGTAPGQPASNGLLDKTQPLDQTQLMAPDGTVSASAVSEAVTGGSATASARIPSRAAGSIGGGGDTALASGQVSCLSGGVTKLELLQLEELGRERLRVEKAQRKEAEKELEEMKNDLQIAQQEHAAWDERMRREMAEERRMIKELDVEIKKHQTTISRLGSTVGAAQGDERRAMETNAAEIRSDRERLVKQVEVDFGVSSPTTFANDYERRFDRMLARRDVWHDGVCQGIEAGHGGDVEALDMRYQQFLAERQGEERRAVEEIERCVAEGHRIRQQLHGDLIDVHDLASQLGWVVDRLVAGVPNDLRTGIRPPPKPEEDLRGRLDSGGLLPDRRLEQLQRHMADVRRAVTRSRQTLKQAAPGRPPQPAEQLARDLCAGGAEARAQLKESLQRLGPTQLRDACLSLRGRARMGAEGAEAERARLCDEVAGEFEGHGALEAVRGLEAEIEGYRLRLQKEEERCSFTRSAIESCARSASASASRASSAGPRGAARRLF